MKLRTLQFWETAVEQLKAIYERHRTHYEVIWTRCLTLQNDAESHVDVKPLGAKQGAFELFISGIELENLSPLEGYRVLFFVDAKYVLILSVSRSLR